MNCEPIIVCGQKPNRCRTAFYRLILTVFAAIDSIMGKQLYRPISLHNNGKRLQPNPKL